MFDRSERVAGKTKWNYPRLIDLAIDGITALSIKPLRIATYFAIPVFLSTIMFFIYALVKLIINKGVINVGHVIIVLILFFGSLLMILLGIIGEYLGRAFVESKNRPIYLIDEYNGEKERNE